MVEQTYYLPNRSKKGKTLFRPLKVFCGIENRGYSKLYQRKIVDFSSDTPFDSVPEKLQEHYGIQAPKSSIRKITYKHANILKQREEKEMQSLKQPPKEGIASIISETDGCFIPIVLPPPPINEEGKKQDRRKNQQFVYKEVRLTLAQKKDSLTPLFSATLGDVDAVGKRMKHVVNQCGFGENTHVHGVGDGASWIRNQIEEQFGSQGSYLIDLYHLCEYLSAAGATIAGDKKIEWMEQQKNLLKNGYVGLVLDELRDNLEAENVLDEEAPVRQCYRYMTNRPDQLDYKGAIENGLPIGSGAIESGHRYVIQDRLKRPGAAWLDINADAMLALRTTRANKNWDKYWKDAA